MKASISLVSIGSSDRNEEGINCTMIFDLTICSCATAVDSSQTSLPEPSDNTLTRLLDYYPPIVFAILSSLEIFGSKFKCIIS